MNKQQFVETIKILDGKFYNLPLHIKRMEQTTLHFFDKTILFPLSEIDIPLPFKKGLVKCRIVYSDTIFNIEYEYYEFRTVDKIAIVEDDNIDYYYKSIDRRSLNKLLGKKGNADDILIVKNGLITDTSYTNVIFENSSGLYTPDSYLLNGIKRQLLIEKGIIQERRISVENIHLYNKIYLINAMIDIQDGICLTTDMIVK